MVSTVAVRPRVAQLLAPKYLPCLILLGAAAVFWIFSIPQIHPLRMNDFGLVSVLPIAFYLCLGALLIGYAVALYLRPLPVIVLAGYNVLMILVIHGTPQLVYPEPRYSWIYKHFGVVDYIMRHGTVDRQISFLGIYHNWPGFFALGALYTEAANFSSALAYAGLAPIFMNLLYLGALVLIFRNETGDSRLIWLAIWVFTLSNSIGQDTFSPQALAYFFFLCIVAIWRRWLRGGTPVWRWRQLPERVRASKVATTLNRVVGADRPSLPPDRQSTGLLVVLSLLFTFAIVSSHQLTPFMLLSAAAGLALTGRFNRPWMVAVAAAMIVLWFVWPAWPWVSANTKALFGSVFAPFSNVNASFRSTTRLPQPQVVISYIDRAEHLLVVLPALLGVWRAVRAPRWNAAMLVLLVAPVIWILLTAYGTEGIDRIYLFALPFLAYYWAELWFPARRSGRSAVSAAVLLALSGALCASLLFAYYGQERANYVPADEVRAATSLYEHSPPGSLLIMGGSDPVLFSRYEHFTYLTLGDVFAHSKPGPTPLRRVIHFMRRGIPTAYVIFTRNSYQADRLSGAVPAPVFRQLEGEATRSPYLKRVLTGPNVAVYELRKGRD